jgi:osmotically-inducible protein OsmY
MERYTKNLNIIFACSLVVGLSGCVNTNNSSGATNSWFNMDRRTAGAIVDDQTIPIKANLAIAKNKIVWKESHISTLSYNNSLLLVGQTKSQAHKQEIERMLTPISEIGNIYNQITVGEPIPMKARANDTWITTQVKAKLISNRAVGINRVKVITEDGVVYLMGRLTKNEEATITDIVRRVNGVNKVVTVFEKAD